MWPQSTQPVDQTALDEVYRLESAIGLVGKNERGVPEFAVAVVQRVMAKTGKHPDGAEQDDGRQQHPAEHEQTGWL